MPVEIRPARRRVRDEQLHLTVPMRHGSYVIIYCQGGRRHNEFDAVVRIGDRANPGLSLAPVLNELDKEVVEKYKKELAAAIEQTEAIIASRSTSPEDRRAARKKLAALCLDVPVLGIVEKGCLLTLHVSSYLPTTEYQLGEVMGWRIFNA